MPFYGPFLENFDQKTECFWRALSWKVGIYWPVEKKLGLIGLNWMF